MSIQFNWDELTKDSDELEHKICDFLHDQFQAIQLPPFISSLAVSSFKLGSVPPEITLKHFSDPFPEFYADADDTGSFNSEDQENWSEESDSSNNPDHESPADHGQKQSPNRNGELYPDAPTASPAGEGTRELNYKLREDPEEVSTTGEAEPGEFDIQSYVELKYAGDMQLALTATLLVNYPSPSFISLPVSIKVTNIEIHSLIVAAFIKARIYLSILSDVENKDNLKPMDNVSVIKNMKIESEIGDNSDNGAVLRNVGKVEKFILEQLRNVIADELVWPGWLTLEL